MDPMDHLSYVAYIYTFGFIVPVTIIFTSYYKIIKTVKYKVRVGIMMQLLDCTLRMRRPV